MTKRLLVLLLVCILAIPIIVVPASATTDHVTDTQFDMFATSLGNLLGNMYDSLDSIVYWVDHIYNDFLVYIDKIVHNTNNIALIKTLVDNVESYQVTMYETMIHGYDEINGNLITCINYLLSIRDRLNLWLESIYNVLFNFYDKAITRLNNIVSRLDLLLSGEPGAADDFNDQVSTEATEFEENMDIIQDVTRPMIEDIDLDIDKEIPDGEVVKVGQLLGIFFQNQYIYIIFFISFTFALVSYGIFGKR